MSRRRSLLAGLIVLLAGCAAVAFFAWPAATEVATASATQPTGAALIARGEYLARAADCTACHTPPGGQDFAGGVAFQLPFGTIYASNISPDLETGIGAWSNADFVRALRHGVDRDGRNLYPAFPYAEYALLTTDDALAIRAYLATVKPVRATPPPNQLAFPFNQRYLVRAWNLLFAPEAQFRPDRAHDEAWNRGAYLAVALGHCGECHTPRNIMMGLETSRVFAGAVQAGWLAYNLTSDREHGLGNWSDEQIEQYLATGYAEGRGPASGPMAEVVENSLQYLSRDDIRAIVGYLRTIPAQTDGPAVVRNVSGAEATNNLGAQLFAQACAGCHSPSGDGRQSAWASLRGAHSAGDSEGTNLLQVLTRGTQIRTAQGIMFMHDFARAYTDEELVALTDYVSRQFAFRASSVSPKQVHNARSSARASARN